jgi:hypothetical protein
MPCRFVGLALAALSVSGCFHPTYDHPACGRNGECPDGLSCNAQGVCDTGGPGGSGSPGSGGGLAAFRLIAPMSLSTVTQRAPTLLWLQTSGDGTPTVDLCKDRACTMTLGITTVMAANRLSAVPTVPLPLGWVYWRVRAGAMTSATWQFWVGKRSATSPVDTSSGAILDVNGDGYPDFLVASQEASAHLYLGGPNPGAAGWNGDPHPGRIDIPHIEVTSLDYSPVVVASAGDVNGDGYGDFLVSSTFAHSGAGAVHLYLGSTAPSAADWDGASSRRIDLGDPSTDAGLGQALAAAGDVNGDGYGDFLVSGGPSMVPARLYFGSAVPSAANWMDPASPDRIDLAAPAGAPAQGSFGRALAGAGDVDGDGFADFVIGIELAPQAQAGIARVYLGGSTPRASDWNAGVRRIDIAGFDGTDAHFGSAVSGGGDIDGDGFSDFVVSADYASATTGTVHVFLGTDAPHTSTWTGTGARRIDLTSPDGPNAIFGNSLARLAPARPAGALRPAGATQARTAPGPRGSAHGKPISYLR